MQHWGEDIHLYHKQFNGNFMKSLSPFLIVVVSLICMATSCPKYHDPFKEETDDGLGTLGFYLDGHPVSYFREAACGKVSEDSLLISAPLNYEDYKRLYIQFAIDDISVEQPIKNPEIELWYVYKVIKEQDEYGNQVTRTQYKVIKAETGELSFRYVGPYEGDPYTSYTTTLSGNFFFEGNDYLDSGEVRKVVVTDGTFDVCYK